MKRIILTLIIMAGFFVTAQAQSDRQRHKILERRMERKIERRRIRRHMERRAHRRRHHRMASNSYTTDMQRSQAVLYKEETASTI